jgi:membrane fusion protein
MSIVPADASLEAHLYAPSRAIGFLQPGQPVYLRYQAFPYQKFGHHEGIIDSVSRAPFNGAELTSRPAASTQANEPVYRVVVRLKKHAVTVNGQELALQPGMQLDADVALERRRLIEWMLEPVYKITGRWHSAAGPNP